MYGEEAKESACSCPSLLFFEQSVSLNDRWPMPNRSADRQKAHGQSTSPRVGCPASHKGGLVHTTETSDSIRPERCMRRGAGREER